jgi:hypothetical protein
MSLETALAGIWACRAWQGEAPVLRRRVRQILDS